MKTHTHTHEWKTYQTQSIGIGGSRRRLGPTRRLEQAPRLLRPAQQPLNGRFAILDRVKLFPRVLHFDQGRIEVVGAGSEHCRRFAGRAGEGIEMPGAAEEGIGELREFGGGRGQALEGGGEGVDSLLGFGDEQGRI